MSSTPARRCWKLPVRFSRISFSSKADLLVDKAPQLLRHYVSRDCKQPDVVCKVWVFSRTRGPQLTLMDDRFAMVCEQSMCHPTDFSAHVL